MEIENQVFKSQIAPSSVTSERKYLAARTPVPKLDDSLLIHTSERIEKAETGKKIFFNTNKLDSVRHVCISGMELIFDSKNGDHNLCKRYRLNSVPATPDIKSMKLIADTIKIRTPLYIPGGDVTIYARQLVFEYNGSISTKPKQHHEGTRATKRDNADNGENGGNIHLFLKENIDIVAQKKKNEKKASEKEIEKANKKVRFILDGAKGQSPKKGKTGKSGRSVKVWDGNLFELTSVSTSIDILRGKISPAGAFGSQATPTQIYPSNGVERVQVYLYYTDTWGFNHGISAEWCNNDKAQPQMPPFGKYKCGVPVFPTNGEKSTEPAGKPGDGGDSGEFCSNIPVNSKWISQKAGKAGKQDPDTLGGDPGMPRNTYIQNLFYEDNSLWSRIAHPATSKLVKTSNSTVHTTHPGPVTPSPKGKDGESKMPKTPSGETAKWMHPALLQTVIHYVKLVYLAGDRAQAVDYLKKYLVPIGGTTEKAGQSDIKSARLQMLSMQNQLDHNLDYFNNPAGWEPLLPLPIVMNIFKGEVCNAMETCFLAHWLNSKKEMVEKDANSVQAAIKNLHKKINTEIDTINSTRDALGKLNQTKEEVIAKQKVIKGEIERLQKKLKEEAESELAAKKFCYFLLHTAATITSLIPWGQPCLGMAGQGLELLTSIDPENPPHTSEDVFGIFDKVIDILTNSKPDDKVAEARKAVKSLAGMAFDIKGKRERKDNKAKWSDAADKLSDLGDKLSPFFSDFSKQIDKLKTPENEIEKRLRELEKQSPAYQALAAQIRTLNRKKKELVNRIHELEKTLHACLGALAVNLNTSVSLCRKLDNELELIDHTTFRYINALAHQEKQTLNRYQYYLVKSYLSYTMPVAAYDKKTHGGILDFVNYQLTAMVKKIIALAKKSQDGLIKIDQSKPESNPIYKLYTAVVREITRKLVNKFFHNPIRQDPKGYTTFHLEGPQLEHLNDPDEAKRSTVISLMDMGKLPLSRERIRLVDFGVDRIELEDGSGVTDGSIEIEFISLGEGTIRCSGKLFAVRHPLRPKHERDRHPYWVTTYDIGKKTLSSEQPSVTDQAFLDQFVKDTKKRLAELIHYCPPAWGNIAVHRTDTGLDKPVKIKSLHLKFKLASAEAGATELNDNVLLVRPKGNYLPKIKFAPKDLNDQTTGWGSIFRMYSNGTDVTITAPKTIGNGKMIFKQWEDNDGNVIGTNPKKKVHVVGNKHLYYVYE